MPIMWRSWFFLLILMYFPQIYYLLFSKSQSSLKCVIPKNAAPRSFFSLSTFRSKGGDARLRWSSKDTRGRVYKISSELGMSIKFSGWYVDAASLWLYILCIYGNSYKLPVELSIVAVWLFFFLIFFTSCVELDLKIYCNLFFQLA